MTEERMVVECQPDAETTRNKTNDSTGPGMKAVTGDNGDRLTLETLDHFWIHEIQETVYQTTFLVTIWLNRL